MTNRQKEALRILSEHPGGLTAKEFARMFWPMSSMHLMPSTHSGKIRYGVGSNLCGGSYLARLAERYKYVVSFDEPKKWTITPEGREKVRLMGK